MREKGRKGIKGLPRTYLPLPLQWLFSAARTKDHHLTCNPTPMEHFLDASALCLGQPAATSQCNCRNL